MIKAYVVRFNTFDDYKNDSDFEFLETKLSDEPNSKSDYDQIGHVFGFEPGNFRPHLTSLKSGEF